MRINRASILTTWLSFLTISSFYCLSYSVDYLGKWEMLKDNIGISAMHMQLLNNNKVIIFDLTSSGLSKIPLPKGKCSPAGPNRSKDCTAHSVIYDIASNTVRPLFLLYNTWCSSGTVIPNGTFIQNGGEYEGQRTLRSFTPCEDNSCDWIEFHDYLADPKWYASNHILPDGRIIIVGGRNVFAYEFYPAIYGKGGKTPISFPLPFLKETSDPNDEYNNLYPFLYLLPDGNLYLFANRRSILFDYINGKVINEYPEIPGVDKRNYPSTGNAALLPLRLTGEDGDGSNTEAEVIVCGGAPPGAFTLADKTNPKVFVEASRTCGRLKVTDPNPQWVMEQMPMPRVMLDMVLLPTGDVFIVNGAARGTAGWEDAEDPDYEPLLYKPEEKPSRRFTVLKPTTIPRMYHSAALLLPDGRVLVGGSNTHHTYLFDVKYPTDLSLEAFSPPYLDSNFNNLRPSILWVEGGKNMVTYGNRFCMAFCVTTYIPNTVSVVMMISPFVTHSFSQNQRMIVLNVVDVDVDENSTTHKAVVDGPPGTTVAPPGYYMMSVVHDGIPSCSVWVKLQ